MVTSIYGGHIGLSLVAILDVDRAFMEEKSACIAFRVV